MRVRRAQHLRRERAARAAPAGDVRGPCGLRGGGRRGLRGGERLLCIRQRLEHVVQPV